MLLVYLKKFFIPRMSLHITAPTFTQLLDDAVRSAQKIDILGHHIHPYLMLVDIGTIAVCSFAYLFTKLFVGIEFSRFLLVFMLVYLSYEQIFLRFKYRILKVQSRSYLQDGLMFLFPAFLFGSWVMGSSIPASIDLLGLMLPLLFGFVRIGCFLGGCCYGIPWSHGVLYPENVFKPFDGYRKFRPSPDPRCRVLPIQLVESLTNFFLFSTLFLRLYFTKDLSGLTLPLYLLFYSIYRTIADFFRNTSARPRRGPFSEAQIVSVFVIIASVIYILAVQ